MADVKEESFIAAIDANDTASNINNINARNDTAFHEWIDGSCS